MYNTTMVAAPIRRANVIRTESTASIKVDRNTSKNFAKMKSAIPLSSRRSLSSTKCRVFHSHRFSPLYIFPSLLLKASASWLTTTVPKSTKWSNTVRPTVFFAKHVIGTKTAWLVILNFVLSKCLSLFTSNRRWAKVLPKTSHTNKQYEPVDFVHPLLYKSFYSVQTPSAWFLNPRHFLLSQSVKHRPKLRHQPRSASQHG